MSQLNMSQLDWKIARCKHTGLSHKESGMECQDNIITEKNAVASCRTAVLADGLGSLSNSAQASRAVTEAVSRWLLRNHEWIANDKTADASARLAAELLQVARKAILDTVPGATPEDPPRDRDCNLAFVAAMMDVAVCGSLGDCAVCVIDDNPRAITDNAAIANATSTVLTGKADQLRIEYVDLKKTNGFLLTSDGMEGEVYRKISGKLMHNAQHYYNTVFSGEDEDTRNDRLSDLVEHLQQTRGGRFDDDISMIVISCSGKQISLPEDPKWLCTCSHRNPLTTTYCQNCRKDILDIYDMDPAYTPASCQTLDELILYYNQHPEEEKQAILRAQGYAPQEEQSQEPDLLIPPRPQNPPIPQDTAGQPGESVYTVPDAAFDATPSQRRNRQTADSPSRKSKPEARPKKDRLQKMREVQEESEKTRRRLETTLGTTQTPAEPTPVKRKLQFSPWLLCAAIALVIVIALLLFRDRLPNLSIFPHASTPGHTETSPETTTGHSSEPTDPILNGIQYVEEDGYFWYGNFVDGQKDGLFWFMPADRVEEPQQALFEDGQRVEETTPPVDYGPGAYRVIQRLSSAWLDLENESKLHVNFEAGDILYRTEAEPFPYNGVTYLQFVYDETAVWIDASYVEPTSQEQGE